MSTIWKITWFDLGRLRETSVASDPFNLINNATMQGVNAYTIIKIEQVPQ